MRITLIGPIYPYRGGIAHYTSHLAQKLLQAEHEVQVISFRRQYPSWLYPGSSDKDPSKNYQTVPAEYLLDPIYPWTWRQTVLKIRAFRPQVVVIQWWTTFWSPAYAIIGKWLRNEGIRVIFLIHNVLPHEEKPWDSYLAKLALSQGTGFITQTSLEKKRFERIIRNTQVSVCPHPVYNGFEKRTLSKIDARQELGLPQDKTILLSFGIVRLYKGLSVLLEAVSILARKKKDVYLVVAGEFWDDIKKYLSQIEKLKIDNLVRIENRYLPDDEVSLYFSACDILVAPYTGGTQSGVVNLGLGYRIPIIVSEKVAVGIPEINTHLITITPTGNAQALAISIENSSRDRNDAQFNHLDFDDGWDYLISVIYDWGRL